MCEIDWSSFGVGWSPEVTLDIPTIGNVHRIITGDQWLEIAELKPLWIQFCVFKEKGKVPPKENKPHSLQELSE